MKLKIFASLVVALMVAGAVPFINVAAQIATQQTQTNDSSTPIAEPYDDNGNSDGYIKIGHIEAIYGNFGDGDITTTAYQTSITLSDDNNDGTAETTVEVDYGIWLPKTETKHVFILFGIWGGGGNRASGSGIATATAYGWNNGEFITSFSCPTSMVSPGGTTFTAHVRGICVFGYDHDTAPFTVSLGTNGVHQNPIGFPQSVNMEIDYPAGTVIANNIKSITAGASIGEYYLHTASGETYPIDDTIPAYLMD